MKMGFEKIVILMFVLMIGLVSASEQTYNLNIDFKPYENVNGSLSIDVDSPEDGEFIGEDIDFNINVVSSNKDSLNCKLILNGISYDLPFSNIIKVNYSSGKYTWKVQCEDINGSESTSGSFVVEEFNLEIENLDEFYFNNDDISGSLNNYNDELSEGAWIELCRGSSCNNIAIESDGEFTIDSSKISNVGEYELIAYRDLIYDDSRTESNSVVFYVGEVSTDINDSRIDLGESVEISLNVDLGGYGPSSADYEVYTENNDVDEEDSFTDDISKTFTYTPGESGTITIYFEVEVDERTYSDDLDLRVIDDSDSEDPELTLIYPEEGDIIESSTITFKYNVEDNVDIDFCEFRLYNATNKNSINSDYLVYETTKDDFEDDDETVEVKIIDFDERAYHWEVYCEDSEGNDDVWFNYFVVDLDGSSSSSYTEATYDRQDEVKELQEKIDSFLESYGDFGLNEARVIEMLGIQEQMSAYDKKLSQIDSDFKDGFRAMTEEKKAEAIERNNAAIDEIADSIVVDVKTVGSSYEYTKNRPDASMEEIISAYFDASDDSIKSAALKMLAKANEELQKFIGTKAEVIEVEIEYMKRSETITLVNKEISLDYDGGIILEVLGDELKDIPIVFVTDSYEVGEGIFEISDIEDGQITYYFDEGIDDLAKVEKTESVIYSEEASSDANMITGFVVAIGDSGFSVFGFFIGFLFLGYVGFLIGGKVRLEVWKKEPNVNRILDLIENTKILLRENNVEGARDNYHKMSEIYKVLPDRTKNFFFKEIKIVKLAIDKKDVLNLVKEYERARSDFRKDDAIILHQKINEVYKRLPKKFQEKVYQRLIKNEMK